jgi:hypothetical protein
MVLTPLDMLRPKEPVKPPTTIRGLKFPPRRRVEPFEVPAEEELQRGAMTAAIGIANVLVEWVTITPEISLIVDEEFLVRPNSVWNRTWAAGPGMLYEGHLFEMANTVLAFHYDRQRESIQPMTVGHALLACKLVAEGLLPGDDSLTPAEMESVGADLLWIPSDDQLQAWLERGEPW